MVHKNYRDIKKIYKHEKTPFFWLKIQKHITQNYLESTIRTNLQDYFSHINIPC
jgi:hypothetical protein